MSCLVFPSQQHCCECNHKLPHRISHLAKEHPASGRVALLTVREANPLSLKDFLHSCTVCSFLPIKFPIILAAFLLVIPYIFTSTWWRVIERQWHQIIPWKHTHPFLQCVAQLELSPAQNPEMCLGQKLDSPTWSSRCHNVLSDIVLVHHSRSHFTAWWFSDVYTEGLHILRHDQVILYMYSVFCLSTLECEYFALFVALAASSFIFLLLLGGIVALSNFINASNRPKLQLFTPSWMGIDLIEKYMCRPAIWLASP